MTNDTIRRAAFTIETVAHLRGLERDLLPIADQLRALDVDALRLALLAASVALQRASSDLCVGCPGGASEAARAAVAALEAANSPA